jgi:2-keto-3-deoxy-L-rhamnonate aldolase RhmA
MAGFDGAFIDTEHTVFDLQLVGEMIRVAELTGITPIVRVPDNDAKLILRLLEMGHRVFRCHISRGSKEPNGP